MSQIIIEIYKNQSLWEIDHALYKAKLIPFRGLAFLQIFFSGKRKQIFPGEYQFDRNTSFDDVLKKLINHDFKQYKLIIPEGASRIKIMRLLYDAPNLVGEVEKLPEEGSCFPSTYCYHKGMRRCEILAQMQQKMTNIGVPAEVIVLASIVEKEADVRDEMPIIASVYFNRLRKKMILQADPTVMYALTHGTYHKTSLSRKELLVKSAYNTYVNRGLPHKPICCPGLSAIKAVLQNKQTRYLYFVAKGTGGHNFSETYESHVKYVTQYRKHINTSK